MDKVILKAWLDKYADQLKPPVSNKVILENEHMLVMAVGGPNNRMDYHYNETPEFFFQIKGNLELHLQKDGNHVVEVLEDDELYLLDAKIPHLPKRSANSLGLVIELKRGEATKDGLQWYCHNCNHKIYEEYFPLNNIEKDFQAVFNRFYQSEENRTCSNCGTVHPTV